MDKQQEVVNALQSLISASELYLNTLDAVAKPVTAQYLNHSISVLVDALQINTSATTKQDDAPTPKK